MPKQISGTSIQASTSSPRRRRWRRRRRSSRRVSFFGGAGWATGVGGPSCRWSVIGRLLAAAHSRRGGHRPAASSPEGREPPSGPLGAHEWHLRHGPDAARTAATLVVLRSLLTGRGAGLRALV